MKIANPDQLEAMASTINAAKRIEGQKQLDALISRLDTRVADLRSHAARLKEEPLASVDTCSATNLLTVAGEIVATLGYMKPQSPFDLYVYCREAGLLETN